MYSMHNNTNGGIAKPRQADNMSLSAAGANSTAGECCQQNAAAPKARPPQIQLHRQSTQGAAPSSNKTVC